MGYQTAATTVLVLGDTTMNYNMIQAY